MNITLKELVSSGSSEDEETIWLRYSQPKGGQVILWGSHEEGTRNIDSVQHQKLPVIIELISPEECLPDEHVKSKYGASISIPEHSYIQIIPEF